MIKLFAVVQGLVKNENESVPCLWIIKCRGCRDDRYIFDWLDRCIICIYVGSSVGGIENNEVLTKATCVRIRVTLVVSCCIGWWVNP